MPVEIKITADTMDELWAMLSTFNVPRVHAGHLSEEDLKRLVTDTSQTIVSSAGNGEDVAVPAHTRGEKEVPAHSKRVRAVLPVPRTSPSRPLRSPRTTMTIRSPRRCQRPTRTPIPRPPSRCSWAP